MGSRDYHSVPGLSGYDETLTFKEDMIGIQEDLWVMPVGLLFF